MTHQLVIYLPQNECITLVSDNVDNIVKASVFCKNELDAYSSTDNINELTVDSITQEKYKELYSLLFELELL